MTFETRASEGLIEESPLARPKRKRRRLLPVSPRLQRESVRESMRESLAADCPTTPSRECNPRGWEGPPAVSFSTPGKEDAIEVNSLSDASTIVDEVEPPAPPGPSAFQPPPAEPAPGTPPEQATPVAPTFLQSAEERRSCELRALLTNPGKPRMPSYCPSSSPSPPRPRSTKQKGAGRKKGRPRGSSLSSTPQAQRKRRRRQFDDGSPDDNTARDYQQVKEASELLFQEGVFTDIDSNAECQQFVEHLHTSYHCTFKAICVFCGVSDRHLRMWRKFDFQSEFRHTPLVARLGAKIRHCFTSVKDALSGSDTSSPNTPQWKLSDRQEGKSAGPSPTPTEMDDPSDLSPRGAATVVLPAPTQSPPAGLLPPPRSTLARASSPSPSPRPSMGASAAEVGEYTPLVQMEDESPGPLIERMSGLDSVPYSSRASGLHSGRHSDGFALVVASSPGSECSEESLDLMDLSGEDEEVNERVVDKPVMPPPEVSPLSSAPVTQPFSEAPSGTPEEDPLWRITERRTQGSQDQSTPSGSPQPAIPTPVGRPSHWHHPFESPPPRPTGQAQAISSPPQLVAVKRESDVQFLRVVTPIEAALERGELTQGRDSEGGLAGPSPPYPEEGPPAGRQSLGRYPLSRDPIGYCVIINNSHFASRDQGVDAPERRDTLPASSGVRGSPQADMAEVEIDGTDDLDITLPPIRPLDQYKDRRGSEVDVRRLRTTFTRLRCDVKVYEDITASQIVSTLRWSARRGAELGHECFLCVLLSHGEEGDLLVGVDGRCVPLRELISIFGNSRHYLGKPKLFFVQACRGLRKDPGARVQRGREVLVVDGVPGYTTDDESSDSGSVSECSMGSAEWREEDLEGLATDPTLIAQSQLSPSAPITPPFDDEDPEMGDCSPGEINPAPLRWSGGARRQSGEAEADFGGTGLSADTSLWEKQEPDGDEPSNEGGEGAAYDPRYSMIPVEADFMVAYATPVGYVSWRSSRKGSWFISCLCEQLDRYGTVEDLSRIMLRVNSAVSRLFKQIAPRSRTRPYCQCPAPELRLTNEFIFPLPPAKRRAAQAPAEREVITIDGHQRPDTTTA